MRFLTTDIIVTSIRQGGQDLYVRGISHILGSIEVIAKNANSGNSRRGALLSRGILINASIYKKNRLYLSEFKVINRYYSRLGLYSYMFLFDYLLWFWERFWMQEYSLFAELVNYLEKLVLASNKLYLFTSLILWTVLKLHILPENYVFCNSCKAIVRKGMATSNGIYCSECMTDPAGEVTDGREIDLTNIGGLLKFLRNLKEEYYYFI